MVAQVKAAYTPAHYTHISTFPFPFQIPSFTVTCSLDTKAIRASQETERYRESD